MSTIEKTKPAQILCAPVLTFTQSDANLVADKCPCTPIDGKGNILFVIPVLDKEGIEKHMGKLIVVHHTKDNVTGEEKVESEWSVPVPITQTMNKNIFQVDIKL
jgi:hypothetical protein